MYKKNLSVVCSVTKRSVQYLDLLSKNKFKLYSVILYKNKKLKILYCLERFFYYLRNTVINLSLSKIQT